MVVTFPARSGPTPVLVVDTTNLREGDDLSSLPSLDVARLRAILFQRKMGYCRVVVGEGGAQEPLEMALVGDNEVIEALTPDRADRALCDFSALQAAVCLTFRDEFARGQVTQCAVGTGGVEVSPPSLTGDG